MLVVALLANLVSVILIPSSLVVVVLPHLAVKLLVVSETILQNEALGRPLDEGVTDAAALGLLSGAAMGAGAGMFARNRRPEDRITPTEDMGQEDANYGPTNPNNPLSGRGLPNPTPLLENQAAPQLGFQGRASNQFNAGPDGEVFTGDQYNEYLAGQQERARQARDSGGLQDIRDITPTPQGYDQAGNDPRLPAPDGTDFTASQDGQVYGRDDINTRLSQERDAAAERRARIARGEIIDRTPIPEAPKPSELMGLDPNKGSLSAAAALAVDSGASDVGNQLRDAVAQEPQMSVWQSGMMDRLSNADQNNSTYARLAQAMQNEPASVSEKARLMREADALPRAEVAAKQIKPNTRVLDESRAQTRAYTPEGKEVQAQWDVVDASDLVTSNTDNFTINPNFPAARQPRDRTRASAQQQVNEIASKLQPNLLGESPDVSTGAPFVGANDNVVDSGNGRSMAIRRVYQEGGEKAGEYRQFVNEQAAKFGLDTDAVNMMQSPVLVRRNTSDMDRDEFARAANKPTAARMSSTEQAASDAKNLPDASLLSFNGDGNMSLYQSQSYLKNFIAGLPSTEQSAMMDDKGALSREGKSRIEAAIVQDAYNNPRLVSAISEKLDNDTTNVLRAVTDKAPQISQINADIKTGDVYDNTLARDIADATQAYIDLKNTDKNINDYLSQDSLLGDGLTDGAKEILSVLSDNRRSAKAIGEYIQERINAVTGRGNPKQGGLSFDDEFETDAPNVLNNEPATQLTDENPTVNIPSPKQTRPKVESTEPPVRDVPIGEWVDGMNNAIDRNLAKQKTDSAADAPKTATAPEVSNEKGPTSYRLPTKEESYWNLSAPSTERESVLVDAVSQALDEGIIYNKDLNKRVAEILNIPQSVLDVNTRNTENGDFGYDVFNARKKVEANNRDNGNNKARERLKSRLSVGRNIGTIVIDNGKTLRRATIESMDGKSVKIAGTTGSKRLMYGVNYSTLEDAIKRAEDEGKREKFAPLEVATAVTESEATPESKLAEKYGFNDSNKLDHGELSIPNRTKNIDNEIDRYKADKAKQDKREREDKRFLANEREAARKPARERADELYKQHGKVLRARVKDKIYGTGNTPAEWLKNEARANPENFIKMAEQIISESEAETNPQLPVDKPETKAESPAKPPQSSVVKTETTPETQKPTSDWQTQMNGNEFRINEDGITVRKHDRVVHIRGANSITANKKAKELANQDIRELHYIAAKEDANDPFSEGSIWLDGNGDMVRKKGTKKPTGSLLPILKQAEAETKKPTAKKADTPATPIETVAEIEDFGEKITGARKDMDSFYQKEITDDDISNQPLSKTWPKKDIDAIEDKQTAALATVLRGTIPSKPRQGYNLKGWVEKVKNARGIMQQIMNDGEMVERFIDSLTKVKSLQTTGYHAQLLTNIDREQWSRVTAVDHRPYYTVKNDDGSTSPDMSFDITVDKRRHVILTENKQISEVVDKVNEILSGEVKAPTLKFDLYSRGRGDAKSWFITQTSDKDKTPLITFNDRDTARAFLKENNNELSELWAQHKEKVNVKKTDTRSRQNRERIGPDHRGGLDVTTEQFMEAFGLRGGQFGNWVKQGANTKDRQGMLNETYDAFMDLAGVLNIPPEAIGLGGKLGMSFGARGKGAAMAHYEPSQVVINLTKTKGAGTLAHEWFHALDHHFTSFRDSSDRNKTREGTYITYKPEPSMMYTPQKGRGYLISKPALKKRQANSKDSMYDAENWAPDPAHPEGVRPKVEEAFADLVNALNDSPMKDRATTIDKGATDGYWSRIIERAARAFESYIIHKLDKQGARSDFLANVTPENAFPRNMDRYPYLLESEMAPVAEAFDNLFATLDSKASEDGNGKTLFSRAGQMKQTMDNVKAGAIGSTQTTRQQVISKLSDKFGKETISKLMADGKLDIKVLSDYVVDGKLTIPSDVDGLYHNGKATLIADNLSDDMIIPTFLHELGGHGGMQTLMDKKAYDALMRDFDSLVKAGDPLAMQAKAMADKVARNEQDALDEYLPYLITLASRQQAKQGKIAGMINRMVMAIRSWLKNTLGVPIAINSQDILSLAERMVNEIEKQGSLDNVANAAPQFSDPNIPDKQMQDVRDKYEGTDEWMKAPNGSDTNLTEQQWLQVRTPAFKEWFGDWEGDAANASKVVDDNGEPMVVYHGTPNNNFNTFDKSKQTTNTGFSESNAFFFTPHIEYAIGYSEFYEDSDENIEWMMENEGKPLSEDRGVKHVFLKIINPVYGNTGHRGAGKVLSDAERNGSDGVLSNQTGNIGAEIAVFEPNQIKSATDNAGTFDNSNPDIRYSRAAGMSDQLDPRNIARESMTRLYDWASSAPPGKLSWWHKTIGTMYNLAQRNPYFKPVFENTEKFINDVSFYAAKASELAPRLLP
ncbi:LPD5 domain-containing protein, partial [Psychrobacter sp.]|uniref:LPD5 domain-containing protein n=1 Tax=Psychrobacter sp. TaxID=56811 RepID=UPI002FDA99E2